MENLMVRATIYIRIEKLFIKGIGIKAKSNNLESLYFKIVMGIQVNGRITKNREEALIITVMEKDMKVYGKLIKKIIMAPIDIKMEMYIKGIGKMIEDMDKGP